MRTLIPTAALLAASLLPSPAHAATTTPLAGHRCFTDQVNPAATIENTVASVAYVATSGAAGAWCEADVWRIKDGTLAVWHDDTLNRVASTSSMTALGLPGSTKTVTLTGDQYRAVRTKGGEPAATLDPFLQALAAHDVPALIEVKNGLGDAAATRSVVNRAAAYGAQVVWYSQPSSTCGLSSTLQRIKDAGGSVGFKMTPACTEALTPAAVANLVGTITQTPVALAANNGLLATRYAERGITVVARHASKNAWPALVGYGVHRNLVNDVRTW